MGSSLSNSKRKVGLSRGSPKAGHKAQGLFIMWWGLKALEKNLANIPLEVFSAEREFHQAIKLVSLGNSLEDSWYPSPTSLTITKDFEPKVTNPPNCFYVQLIRQSVYQKSEFDRPVFDYDERFIKLLDPQALIALGLHEAVYHIVLRSPKYETIDNVSVFVRRLTSMILNLSAQPVFHLVITPDIEAMLESIGYQPYHRPKKIMTDADGREIYGSLIPAMQLQGYSQCYRTHLEYARIRIHEYRDDLISTQQLCLNEKQSVAISIGLGPLGDLEQLGKVPVLPERYDYKTFLVIDKNSLKIQGLLSEPVR